MTSKTNRQATVAPCAPAVTCEPDPIFDLIATHREAWTRYVDIDAEYIEETASPELAALHHKLFQSADTAMDKLMETAPATLAGAAVVIRYFIEIDDGSTRYRSGEYLLTLIHSPIFAGAGGQV
jgi:hypothetical protein